MTTRPPGRRPVAPAEAARLVAVGLAANLGRLLPTLLHDMQQPLAVIGLAAENALDELAEGPPLGDGFRDRLALMQDRVEAGMAMVRRMQALLPEAHHSAATLGEALPPLHMLARALLRGVRGDCSLDLPEDLAGLAVRPGLLEQVVPPLLLNMRDALAALPVGPPRRGGLVAWRSRGALMLAVSDSGGGFEAQVRERLFTPFNSGRATALGAGLGLYAVQAVLRGAGGRLSLSPPGEPTRVILHLPLVAVAS